MMGTQVMDEPLLASAPRILHEQQRQQAIKEYHVASPDNKEVFAIPKEMYDAIADVLRKGQSGSVEIQFRNGGIAGVESRRKWK